MDWPQILTIVAANMGIFFWLKSDSDAERKQMQQDSAADRRNLFLLTKEMADEFKAYRDKKR